MSEHAAPQPQIASLADFEREQARLLDLAESNPDALEGLHEHQGNPITLAPRVPETDDWVNKQISRTEAATEEWKKNVMRPKRNPLEAAKAAKGKWENAMRRAIEERRFEAGLDAVDEETMYAVIAETPSTALAEGVRRRAPKIRQKVDRLRGYLTAHLQAIDRMPVDTDQQREQKMLANLRGMKEIGRRMKGLK